MSEYDVLLPENFQINPARPIYEQFVEQIAARIATGAIASGTRLPSVREMAAGKRINPTTAARTYQELERMGLIVTYRGQGTFVTTEQAAIADARKDIARGAVAQLRMTAELLGLSIEQIIQLADEEEG